MVTSFTLPKQQSEVLPHQKVTQAVIPHTANTKLTRYPLAANALQEFLQQAEALPSTL